MIARVYIDVKDRATEDLNRKVAALAPERVARVAGPRLRELTRDHIKKLPRNKKGWPSTGFWEDAARGTTWEVLGDVTSRSHVVVIHVNKIGFRQRFHGGVIRGVDRKFLTIPISPQAYGRTVADFPGAFLIKTPKGAYIVQYGGSVGRRGGMNKHGATLEFLFKLKASVRQAEMPWIIPSATTYNATAIGALEDYFRQVKTSTGGAN